MHVFHFPEPCFNSSFLCTRHLIPLLLSPSTSTYFASVLGFERTVWADNLTVPFKVQKVPLLPLLLLLLSCSTCCCLIGLFISLFRSVPHSECLVGHGTYFWLFFANEPASCSRMNYTVQLLNRFTFNNAHTCTQWLCRRANLCRYWFNRWFSFVSFLSSLWPVQALNKQ